MDGFKAFVVSRAGRVVRVEWADSCFRLMALAPGERVEYVGTWSSFDAQRAACLFGAVS